VCDLGACVLFSCTVQVCRKYGNPWTQRGGNTSNYGPPCWVGVFGLTVAICVAACQLVRVVFFGLFPQPSRRISIFVDQPFGLRIFDPDGGRLPSLKSRSPSLALRSLASTRRVFFQVSFQDTPCLLWKLVLFCCYLCVHGFALRFSDATCSFLFEPWSHFSSTFS